MTDLDFTRLLQKIVPEKDGEKPIYLRKGTIAAVNSDGTVDVIMSETLLEDRPVVGQVASFAIGQHVQCLVGLDTFLVLGGIAATGNTTPVMPQAFATFGTTSIPNTTLTALTPATVPINVGSMYPGSGSTFTVPVGQGGLYEMGLVLRFASQATSTGQRHARFFVNGAEYLYLPYSASGLDGTNSQANGNVRRVLAAGDTVSFSTYQSSGGALALTAGCHAWIERKA